MSTMKEAFIHPGPKVEIRDTPIPKPEAGQVLIKTVCSGSNPKDWKVSRWTRGCGGKIYTH